jgi:hypothetical protein
VRDRDPPIGDFFQKPKAILTGSGAMCRIVTYPRKTGRGHRRDLSFSSGSVTSGANILA